jgi:hypothetical protein
MALSYAVTIYTAVTVPAVIAVVTPDLAELVIASGLVLGLIVGSIVYRAQRRGKRRFRDAWNMEHGEPTNPQ